ncbi:MAG: 2-oxo acid dehydrogenase subunit E2 [Ruminococcaceae bacterium]|nr:2-oxo acid dehydrogenase subunit E2 [Oscillospiraceae bacterium]
MNTEKARKRRIGDRYDGYRVREKDPMFHVIPHIMRSRLDSQVFFEEKIDISGMRSFIVEHRKEIPNLSLYHVIVAAVIRTIVEKPRLNRFVSGRKVYARSYLRASLAVKKEMSEDGEEALVMPEFAVTDTLKEIAAKFNNEIIVAKQEGENSGNDTDLTIKILNLLPGFLIKFFVWSMRNLDAIGMMPKVINRVSPFHSSLFVTNVGSIGLDSVYHHLYEFGTTSIFLAIGKKGMEYTTRSDGSVDTKHFVPIRFVLDERICDGYYYATAIKTFKRYMKNPELLLQPPSQIGVDL